jgi:hypothetical protein
LSIRALDISTNIWYWDCTVKVVAKLILIYSGSVVLKEATTSRTFENEVLSKLWKPVICFFKKLPEYDARSTRLCRSYTIKSICLEARVSPIALVL